MVGVLQLMYKDQIQSLFAAKLCWVKLKAVGAIIKLKYKELRNYRSREANSCPWRIRDS